jgi:hypothetical protein
MNTENHSLLLITVAPTHIPFLLPQTAPASLVYTAEYRVEGSVQTGRRQLQIILNLIGFILFTLGWK